MMNDDSLASQHPNCDRPLRFARSGLLDAFENNLLILNRQ
jgi:hypothetical protein